MAFSAFRQAKHAPDVGTQAEGTRLRGRQGAGPCPPLPSAFSPSGLQQEQDGCHISQTKLALPQNGLFSSPLRPQQCVEVIPRTHVLALRVVFDAHRFGVILPVL